MVYRVLESVSIILAALGMGLALAHALELPGKRRLSRDGYLLVQQIYYPGFTIGGFFGEPLAILATLLLLLFTPLSRWAFWLVLFALTALAIEHAVFWVVVQPVNRRWLRGQKLDRASAAFFAAGSARESPQEQSWTTSRDTWEAGHIVRMILAAAAFVALVIKAVFT